ncbi:MAG: DUF1576 domain-containing protein [Rectinema sp.]|jgi:hypothetical protein|uniref:DUF1576 domain-containing protein n=1 Tax=uncultured spirochete TaxID=156406 RepID=A0A3P3XRE8_9SPIR|nr:conserved membrane hypothetical protein [uncultured spirochete]
MVQKTKTLNAFVVVVMLGLFLAGMIEGNIIQTFQGFFRLQVTPARLVSDFIAVEGVGPTLLNVAAVGLLGYLFVILNGLQITGAEVAALFTMMGFAFFGKTLFNCIPIMIGVSLSALIVKKKPRDYALIAMFGTAMGPLITFIAFELGMRRIFALPGSFVIGIGIGIVLPPIAIAMLRLHQGYNLYNVGFSAGFLGLFTASLSHAAGADILPLSMWSTAREPLLVAILPAIVLIALLCIVAENPRHVGTGFGEAFRDFRKILTMSGRLPSDFADYVSSKGSLLNAAIMGILFWLGVVLLDAPLNGPVLGGLFTIVGFSFFGKHPKNVFSVVLGIVVAIIIFGKDIYTPGPLLAILFGTALAPLAGEFGPIVGFIAGFLHLVIVDRTGAWHGGMDLYNNGFAAGLTATLIVSIIEWYRSAQDE